jgi:hypothetical protein
MQRSEVEERRRQRQTTRKIIVVPCFVNSWLNNSADTAVPFGPLSCQRLISASRPPMPNQASAVYM